MRFLSILLALVVLPVAAAEDGRYEAVVIPQAGRPGQSSSLYPKVFILDTREGHLWTWSENEAIYEDARTPRFGSALIYQGRLRPGTRMGEIVDKDFDRR